MQITPRFSNLFFTNRCIILNRYLNRSYSGDRRTHRCRARFVSDAALPNHADRLCAPIIEATLYGALAALIFTIWPLARAENIKAAILFRDGGGTAARLPRPIYVIITFGLTAILLPRCLLFHGFHRADTVDRGGCIGALAILSIAPSPSANLPTVCKAGPRGVPRYAGLSAIGGTSEGATAVILSIGLGLGLGFSWAN